MTVLGIVLLTVLACLAAGLPFALLLARPRSWWTLAADALLAGFVLAGLVPTLFGWLGPTGAVVAAAGWLAALVVVLRRRPRMPRPHRPGRADTVLIASGAVVAVVALAQRLHVVNFLPWVGDMGAYVNWANQFARTGELSASWPPVLPAYLGASSWIFGTEWTTVPLAASGLVLLVAVARALHLLRVDRWIILAAVTVVAMHAHAVWYSNFPSSETLNASYFVIWLATLIGALRAVRPIPWIAASGVAMLVLGLLRGTGPFLLFPLGAVALASLVFRDWRHLAHRIWTLVAANLAGALVAYWYGITEIRFYYVDFQLAALVPRAVLEILTPVTTPGPWAVALLVLALLAVVAVAALAGRLGRRPRPPSAGPRVVMIGLAIVMVLGVAATAAIGTASWEILLRMGLWLAVGVVAALFLATGRDVPRRTAVLVTIAGSTVVLFYGFHTLRLTFHDSHSFYIYWDRYLVSEVLPAAIVLTALALEIVRRRVFHPSSIVAPRWRSPRVVTPLAVLATAAVIAPQVPALGLVARDSFFAGAYRFQTALESHVDDTATPIVWASTSPDPVPGFFFPNTWMAFARPMQYTSGLNVVRSTVRKNDFGPDEVLDEQALAEALACSTTGSLLVYEVRNGGEALVGRVKSGDLRVERVGTEVGGLSILSQPPTAGWTVAAFTVDVWSVSGSTSADCVP